MRLLLDENLSPRRVGGPLRDAGHDVRAIAEQQALTGLTDRQVMELAGAEQRILVTRNSRDFAPILRGWAEAGREHAGAILIWTHDHHEFGAIVTGVEGLLARRPTADQWRGIVLAL